MRKPVRKPNLITPVFSLAIFLVVLGGSPAPAQNKDAGKAIVRGKLELPGKFDLKDCKFLSSRIVLLESFVPSPVPTPEGFAEWEQQKRSEWFAKWEKSAAGIRYQQSENKRFDSLNKYETKVGDQLGFDFSKVVPGEYDLAGEIELQWTVDGRAERFIAEFAAQVKVTEVAEVALKTIPLICHRWLRVGDPIPTLSIDGKPIIGRDQLAKKKTLVIFYWKARGLGQELSKKLAAFEGKKQLQILTIGVGKDDASIQQTLVPKSDFSVSIDRIDSPICTAWGVRALPSFWLVSSKGAIAKTSEQFFEANFQFSKLVDE